MPKRMQLRQAEEIARIATRSALEGYREAIASYPADTLYLEGPFDDEEATFELCSCTADGQRIVLARTTVSRLTGEVTRLDVLPALID